MSAPRPSHTSPFTGDRTQASVRSTHSPDVLRARRREVRLRRRLARIDLALGLLCAIVLLVVTPGVAIAGLVAVVALALCGVSFALERRRSRRARGS